MDCPTPAYLSYYLRGLGTQGILETAQGIIVGKPCRNHYYEEYKLIFSKILKEYGREEILVLCNVNFGHCPPSGLFLMAYNVKWMQQPVPSGYAKVVFYK